MAPKAATKLIDVMLSRSSSLIIGPPLDGAFHS
jgi:hypothetical protein